ncbi:hypothetical protein GCM10020216_087780 [Nonomuraea helvata]
MDQPPTSWALPECTRPVGHHRMSESGAELPTAGWDEIVRITENVYESAPQRGGNPWRGGQRLLFPRGAVVYQAQLHALAIGRADRAEIDVTERAASVRRSGSWAPEGRS